MEHAPIRRAAALAKHAGVGAGVGTTPVTTGGVTPVPGGTIPTGTTGGFGTGMGGTEDGATRLTVSTAINPLVYGFDNEYAES